MTQIYSARRQERLTVESFLLFLAGRTGKPRIALCEESPDLLGKWHPAAESHTELIDAWQGINRAQLVAERQAAAAAAGDCPCEREPGP